MATTESTQETEGRATKRARLGDRTMLACIGCKQKKLKCDGQSPRCRHCVKNDRDCLVEDPATGLQRPRDYMQALESRVAMLEDLLQQNYPEVATDHLPLINGLVRPPVAGRGRLVERNGSLSNTELPQLNGVENGVQLGNMGQTPQTTTSQNELTSEVALLCLNAAGREPHYFGPSSSFSFARMVSLGLRLQDRDGTSPSSLSSEEESSAKAELLAQLPTPKIGALLTQAYFDNIHGQYPFLHRPTFLNWEKTCMQANQAENAEHASNVAVFFVFMVYAIASLITEQGRHQQAETYYAAALDRLDFIVQRDSIESIQAMLSCAVYSIRSPFGASIWRLSGMAIRQCIELGYHRSASRFRPTEDPLTSEMSKRVFWVAYDLDRVAAFTLGRPPGIPDDAIDVEFPLDIADNHITPTGLTTEPRTSSDTPPNAMSQAIHMIKMRKLWSAINSRIYLPMSRCQDSSTCQSIFNDIKTLRMELDQWFAETPTNAQDPVSGALSVFASKQWFTLAYHHSIILLYRPYLTYGAPEANTYDTRAMDEVYLECAARAGQMCVLYRQLYRNTSVQYTWGSLHILFLAGLTYLHCLWSSRRVRETMSRVDVVHTTQSCTLVLVIIAERWKSAASYRDIFEQLAEKTISMICEGGSSGRHEASQASRTEAQAQAPNQDFTFDAPIDEWMQSLNNMTFPDESEWLLQEFLQSNV